MNFFEFYSETSIFCSDISIFTFILIFLQNTLIHLFLILALILSSLPWYQNALIHLFLILQNTLIHLFFILALILSSLLWYQNKEERKKDSFYIHIALILKIRKKIFFFMNHFCSDNKYKKKFYNLTTFYIRKGENFFKMVKWLLSSFSYKKGENFAD